MPDELDIVATVIMMHGPPIQREAALFLVLATYADHEKTVAKFDALSPEARRCVWNVYRELRDLIIMKS